MDLRVLLLNQILPKQILRMQICGRQQMIILIANLENLIKADFKGANLTGANQNTNLEDVN